jgi:hypothetical protein
MIFRKRWILPILLAGFLSLTLFAAVGAHQSRVELQQARKVTLGTLVCRKTGENTWAGTTQVTPPYVFAHGISLIQPKSHAEPWKGARVRTTFLIEGTNAPIVFGQSGDFWPKEGRNEFFLSHPAMQEGGMLGVELSNLKAAGTEKEIKLEVANWLCGCESVVGDFLSTAAWGAGFASMVLAVLATRAYARRRTESQW